MARILEATIELDSASIANRHISATLADTIYGTKVSYIDKPGTNLGFAIGATPTTREEIIYTSTGAGTIRGFHGLFNDTGTSMGITYDLKKNGTTVLSSPISFTHADTDKVTKDGTISVLTFVAGDILSIAMTVTTSTGCVGPYAWAVIEETYCPTA